MVKTDQFQEQKDCFCKDSLGMNLHLFSSSRSSVKRAANRLQCILDCTKKYKTDQILATSNSEEKKKAVFSGSGNSILGVTASSNAMGL